MNNMNDIARLAFSAYTEEMYDCLAIRAGENYYGHVNECRFGDQCEGHAVYCDNEKSPYRKCRYGWYYSGDKKDKECNFFEPNDFFVEVLNEDGFLDVKESQRATFNKLLSLNLAKIDAEEEE